MGVFIFVFISLFIEILLIGKVLYDYLYAIEKVIINILKILSVENVSGNKFDFNEARANIKIIEGNTTPANLNKNHCKDCIHNKLCGKCVHNTYDNGDFLCGNTNGDNYGCYVAYDDSCEDWEEKS